LTLPASFGRPDLGLEFPAPSRWLTARRPLNLLQEMPGSEMVAHPEHDLLPVERFGQEVGGAECRCVALCDAAFLFDQDDDRRETGAVSVAPEPSQYLHAVGRRHAEVKEDQVVGEVAAKGHFGRAAADACAVARGEWKSH